MTDIFITIFENKTDKAIRLYDARYGFLNEWVLSGETKELKATSLETTFARYERVVFSEEKVDLIERDGWKEPDYGPYQIRCLNVDGAEVEHRDIGGRRLHLMRGVPVVIDLREDDPMAKFESYEIRRVKVKVASMLFSNYLIDLLRLRDVLTSREDGHEEFIEIKADDEIGHEFPAQTVYGISNANAKEKAK